MGAAAKQIMQAVKGTAAPPGTDAEGCSLLLLLLLTSVTVFQTQ